MGDTRRVREGKGRLREAAISALLSASTIQEAAKKVGVSKRTLLRWMKEPDFRTEYGQAKADALKMASAILTRNSAKAALVLAEVFSAKKPKQNQAARVSAAIGNIRLAHESFEIETLEERICKLELQGQDSNEETI